MSEVSTGRIVSFTLDPLHPPYLTPEEKQRLHAMKDEDIDLSDIPEQSGRGKWIRPGLSADQPKGSV